MIKILESKLASAQKDAFSIQENSSKKDSEIMSLKAELEHIKSKLASKIDELERLKSDTTSVVARPRSVIDYWRRRKKYAERGTKFHIEF